VVVVAVVVRVRAYRTSLLFQSMKYLPYRNRQIRILQILPLNPLHGIRFQFQKPVQQFRIGTTPYARLKVKNDEMGATRRVLETRWMADQLWRSMNGTIVWIISRGISWMERFGPIFCVKCTD